MKRIFIMCMLACTAFTAFSQTDSSKTAKADTIKIGGMIIIRDKSSQPGDTAKLSKILRMAKGNNKKSNLKTNWFIVDFGFANYTDNTVYGIGTAANLYAPGSNGNWFSLKGGKSVNVNIWFFMQNLNITKHVLNLKYGLGFELNNYRFKQPIRYIETVSPTNPNPPRVYLDQTPGRAYKKNKLAADYITVPIMLNVNFTPDKKRGFGLSAGISAGYLYSARNKTITSDEKLEKAKDDFELDRFKLSYVGEISLGRVRLYGSLAMKNMYKRGLDFVPYTLGFRLSGW